MGNVLVIDDESDLLLLCRINLTSSDMSVRWVDSGQEGLRHSTKRRMPSSSI
jgi:DNA-binding response OmpR family regulator